MGTMAPRCDGYLAQKRSGSRIHCHHCVIEYGRRLREGLIDVVGVAGVAGVVVVVTGDVVVVVISADVGVGVTAYRFILIQFTKFNLANVFS